MPTPPGLTSQAQKHSLEFWLPAAFLATGLYGVVFALSCTCILTLREASRRMSRQRAPQNLQLYILILLIISTGNIVSSIRTVLGINASMMGSALGNPLHGPPQGKVGMVCLVLATWGADGFLLWRCLLLYGTLSSALHRRIARFFIAFLLFVSLGCGIAYITLAFVPAIGDVYGSVLMFTFSCTSVFINIVISIMVIARIVIIGSYNDVSVMKGQGRSSIYAQIIATIIESAFIIVLFDLAYIIFTLAQAKVPFKSVESLIPMISLTQVHVIASELIVYRIATSQDTSLRITLPNQTETGDLSFGSSNHAAFKFESY